MHWFASFFLLLVFLGSKSMEYHTVTHMDEDSMECEWCDFALLLQATPFEPAPEAASEMALPLVEPAMVSYTYTPVLFSQEPDFRNFSRPPPSRT